MRLPTGYPRFAFFGIAAIVALFAVSSRVSTGVSTRGVDGRTPAPVTAERAEGLRTLRTEGIGGIEGLAVVASVAADGPAHAHVSGSSIVSGSSMQFGADVETLRPPPPAAAREPLAVAGTLADRPRSTSYEYGNRAQDRVSLTFDAGADVGYTADILDTLARERVVASFGLTGAWVEQNPALVKRMAAEGHHLINHTWSHDSFTGLSTGRGPKTRAQRWEELDRTEAVIQRVAGVSTLPYFRPPYGDMDASVLADVGARGYTVTAMWAVDSAGWNGLSAPRIVERTLRLTGPGAILIFHVGSQSQDAAALPAIIRGLRERGYEFVSVRTLVGG